MKKFSLWVLAVLMTAAFSGLTFAPMASFAQEKKAEETKKEEGEKKPAKKKAARKKAPKRAEVEM